jgi:hypothetical protein
MPTTAANRPVEIAFRLASGPDEEVAARFTTPAGHTLVVPAFCSGGHVWRVRYASSEPGEHSYSLPNGGYGTVTIEPYTGRNVLYRHGPLHVSEDRRFLMHADGTPFFWLGDTWWMGLCRRLAWPGEFRALLDDRVRKGFTVVQIVAGLYPDQPAFDERSANEAGFPWEPDYSAIRPAYFDMADRRIRALVERGLVPCIVGAWGYHLPWMGVPRMCRHWREVIARWAAYPVVWCIAGEANLPWYLAEGFPYDDREQVRLWTQVARYVRATDPFQRIASIHPTGLGRLSARGAIDDQSLLDFDMLQTGHGDRQSLGPSVETLLWSRAQQPKMPVLNSEVNYEGILGACKEDVQRLMFWVSVLSGACGHTYGANGIWQLNQIGKPYGKSPHGGDYNGPPWPEAMRLPGSAQLGLARRLLMRMPWWRLQPLAANAAEWADGGTDSYMRPYAAAADGGPTLIYLPEGRPVHVESPNSGTAHWWNPRTGRLRAAQSKDSRFHPPDAQDWVLILGRLD